MIPTPHLTLTVPELASPLYNKLYQIRVGVQALVDTAESRVEAARAELEGQLETERKEREEEEQRRTEAEQELREWFYGLALRLWLTSTPIEQRRPKSLSLPRISSSRTLRASASLRVWEARWQTFRCTLPLSRPRRDSLS